MSKKKTQTIIVLVVSFVFLLVACRRKEEEPSPIATSPVTEVVSTPETAIPPTPTPEPAEPTRPPVVADWPPQLIYSSPAPGEETLLGGAITIRFDQPMDQDSVIEALLITRQDDDLPVSGSIEWPRSDTIVFTPRSSLERKQTYQVKIGGSARGRNGQPLREPVDLRMQTVGYLEVSQVIPQPNTNDVGTESAITVIFNRPVVPLVTKGQQASLPVPLSFEPNVVGAGEWVSTSIYRFEPEQPLAGATQYQISIDAGLEDVTGGILQEPFSWDFRTSSPSVVSITPEDGSEGVVPTGSITVTFNMPMDRGSTETAISLEPPVAVAYQWAQDSKSVGIKPVQSLDLATTYQLLVSASARAATGLATLDESEISNFETVPFPAVIETFPPDGSTIERFQRGVTIRFAAPMDVATLEDKVEIEPAPNRVRYFFNEFDNSLFLDFEFLRNIEYVITVPASASDPYGNSLGQPYNWSFTTPGFSPLISLNLPNLVGQLSTSHPSNIGVIYRNVSRIDAELFDLGLPADLLMQPYRVNFAPLGAPIRTYSEPVSAAQDRAEVFTLSLNDDLALSTGVYYLTVASPEMNPDDRFWQQRASIIVVADTNLVVKEMFGAVHVWATDLASGQPVAGRDIGLFDRDGLFIGSAVTDEDGFASYDYRPLEDFLTGVLAVSGTPGQPGFGVANSQWAQGINPWEFGLDASNADEPRRFAYLYTDRPLYRPGDTVNFRGIVRDTNYGRYALPSDDRVRLTMDFFTSFEPTDFEWEGTLDDNGEFSGEYQIPLDARLGTYQFSFATGDIDAQRMFSVAEYRKPEFQVKSTPARKEIVRGEPIEVVIEASYFFGGPATDLELEWAVFVDDFRLPWDGPYYNFGDSGGFFYEPIGRFGLGGGAFLGEQITRGSGRTDEDGRFTVRLPAGLLDEIDAGSKNITVEATVFDLSNFPITARATVIAHQAETYVGVVAGDRIGTAGISADVDLVTVDWSGQPVPDQDVELVFYRREWEPVRVQEFGSYYTRWEAHDFEIARVATTTDEQGRGTASFVPPEGGTYLAVASVADRAGREQISSTTIWAVDADFFGWRSDPREKRMDLVPDRDSYRTGDTAHLLVQSPFSGPVKAWLTIERGTLLEQRIITLDTDSDLIDIPIGSSFAPNVFVTIHVVKGIDEDNQYADIRVGIAELLVEPEPLSLNLTLTPRASVFEPGGAAIYDILTTDSDGNPVSANLSLSLVDLAVLTLKSDNAPNILDAFYSRQPMRSQTGAGLIISGEGMEVEIPLEVAGLGGGGGGGLADTAAQTFSIEEEEDIRQDFPDTAFWQPQLLTDFEGRATVEIPLPDSVTTWRLSVKGVSLQASTNETLVGQKEVDVIATLPLLIRPVTPRFFAVGDSLQIGAIVHNNTDSDLETEITLEAVGLSIQGPVGKTLTVPAGGRVEVQWPVLVDDVEEADLTFRAAGGEYRDDTKPTFGRPPDQLIPVTRFSGQELAGTSGVLEEEGRRVEAILLPAALDERKGGVQIEVNASLAAALTDALEYVNWIEDRPACAHAVTNQLLPNVATARAYANLGLVQAELSQEIDRLIGDDIARLESLQRSSGGWGWCSATETDPFLSAYALFALAMAQGSGYSVSNDVLNLGTSYLKSQLKDPSVINDRSDANRQSFFLYVLTAAGDQETDALNSLFEEARPLMDPYAKGLLLLAFEQAGVTSHHSSLLADLNDSVLLSAGGAHWEDAEPDWDNLSSDVRGTAMVLTALAIADPENPIGANAVRWIMVARTADHWTTGQDSAWSIVALTDWMQATGELEADYEYSIKVNGREVQSGRYDEDSILESEQVEIAIGDLIPDDVNFLDFQRGLGDGRFYYTAYLDSFVSAENLAAANHGIIVQRTYYDADCDPNVEICEPIERIEAGEQIRVVLNVVAPSDLVYVIIEDPIPAGAEALDPGLLTTASETGPSIIQDDRDYRLGYWGWWYFNNIEFRDDRVAFMSEFLPAGTYQYSYTLQTIIPGTYQVIPATAHQEFFPDVFGRSEGLLFTITE